MDSNTSVLSQLVNGISSYFKSEVDVDESKLEDLVKSLLPPENNISVVDPSPVKEVTNVVKKFDEEEMIAIEPLYINVGEADVHKDGITDESLDQLVDNFNANIDTIKSKIHHAFETDGFIPLKAYRLPMDVYVGDPNSPEELTLIEEGQPVVKMKFTDTKYWEKRKSGFLGSVSIGCKAERVPNPDYEGDE
jgi:hypothetical protein